MLTDNGREFTDRLFGGSTACRATASKAAADARLTTAVLADAEARKLILLSCGTRYNVIRLPPLTIPIEQLHEALDIIEVPVETAMMKKAA